MIVFIASVLPIALYLLVLMVMDGFALARWSMVGRCTAVGVLACLVLWLLAKVWSFTVGDFSLMPFFEELLKGLLLVYLVVGKRIRFMAEAIIYGAAVGGGFALLENILYMLAAPDMHIATAIVRGLGSAVVHIGCTALVACLLILLVNGGRRAWLMIIAAYIPAVILHFVHNEIHVPTIYKMAVMIVLFLCMFRLFFKIGNSKVYNWIDHSVSYDVQTLSAIRRGEFSLTKAGEYLLGMKSQFQPEVFFDMLCYVQTYLEIKIEKQSLMLLYDSGFKDGEFDRKYAVHNEKKIELEALKKNIGKTGMSVLSPLVQDEI